MNVYCHLKKKLNDRFTLIRFDRAAPFCYRGAGQNILTSVDLLEVIFGAHLRKHLRLLVGYCETSVTGSHAMRV